MKYRNLISFTIVTIILMMTVFGSGFVSAAESGSAIELSEEDYSNEDNWLSFGGDKEHEADIFVIYPTVTMSLEKEDRPYVRIESETMRTMAGIWLKEVRGLFEESANIYAPFYKQLNSAELNDLDADGFIEHTNGVPCGDVFAAFDYYLKNENEGRPFILLGHSQGAQLVTQLATVFLGDEEYIEYNDRHIATYAIGCPVLESQIELNSELDFSMRPNDIGVIVSWNTVSPSEVATGVYEEFGTWKKDALTTNPITWRSNEFLAHASANAASRLTEPDGSVVFRRSFANALVDKEHDVLITTTVDESKYISTSSRIGKFHRYDIAFYYISIKENISDRINAYFSSY